jgi:probable Rubsico expression protein CbbX
MSNSVVDFSFIVGGMIGIGGLCAAVAVGLRRQERANDAVSPDRRLRVLQPTSGAAPLASPGGRRRRGELELLPPGAKVKRRRGELELLPPGAKVNFADERKASKIDDLMAALDRDLVGLVPIKRKVEEIASLLLVDRARNKFGLTAPRPSLHMCFTGPPGTGKTTMALRMADLLHRLGYLEKGQLVHAMRDDLVGEFVGHTAPKTRRVLDRAMGGVLFIDEAYYLYRAADSKDFGQEVIDILLQVMENERENLVVVLAGYKDRMEDFFTVNPGMRSRIAHHLDFAPYDLGELVSIGELMLDEANYHLSPTAAVAFREEVARQMDQPGFANARSVRNDLDRARLRHAHRLAADVGRLWTRDELMRLEAEDVVEDDLGLVLNPFGGSATIPESASGFTSPER